MLLCQTHVSLRVFGVIKYWLENFFNDFKEERVLVELLIDFMRYLTVKTKSESWAKQSAHRLLTNVQYFNREESETDGSKGFSMSGGRLVNTI